MLERTPKAFVNACWSLLWNSGYSATIDMDLRGWVSFLSHANPHGTVNAAFNPEFHRLEPDNSFWLSIRRRSDGKAIACICDRLIDTDDFVEDQRTMRLWYGDPMAHGVSPIKLAQPKSSFPFVSGKVGHHGGLWVDRSERHNGLAWLLCRMIRAMTLERWPDTGWHCGTTLEPLVLKGLPENTYGYTRWDLIVDEYFPVTGHQDRAYMTSISANEMLLQIARDLSLIEMDPNQKVRDLVCGARERQGHAPVQAAMVG
jgi:hypothetical protein